MRSFHGFLRESFPEDKGVLDREKALIDNALTYHFGTTLEKQFHRPRHKGVREEYLLKHAEICLKMIKTYDGMLERNEYARLYKNLRADGSGNMFVRREYAVRLARAASEENAILAASAANFAGPYTSNGTFNDAEKNVIYKSAARQLIGLLSGDNPGEVMDRLGIFRKESRESIGRMLRQGAAE